MSLSRVLLLLLAVCVVSDALIEFEKSRIYDEKDFEGQGTVYLPLYCSEGCHIYVSVPEYSVYFAQRTFIEDFSGKQTSFFDANTKDDAGHKIPYVVAKGNAQVNFVNTLQISAPILVWIVRGDAPNIDNVEVYDANHTMRSTAPAGIITILDAEPFVVTTNAKGEVAPFTAITAGFDALGSTDNCTRVFQRDSFTVYQDLVGADIRSPLFTIIFNSEETEVSLLAHKNIPCSPLWDTMYDQCYLWNITEVQWMTSYVACAHMETGSGLVTIFNDAKHDQIMAEMRGATDGIWIALYREEGALSGNWNWITQGTIIPLDPSLEKYFAPGQDFSDWNKKYVYMKSDGLWYIDDIAGKHWSLCQRDRYPKHYLSRNQFVTSPGYIGCSVKEGVPSSVGVYTKSYRSSLYDPWTMYEILSDKPVSIILSSDINVDQIHAVDIGAYGEPSIKWAGNRASPTTDMNTSYLSIGWERNVEDLDQSFMIRVEQDNRPQDDCAVSDGICYLLGANVESWQDAQAACRTVGAVLASIHGSQENDFIRRLAVSNGKVNGLLLGAAKSGKGDDFGWIDGSAWDYENFYPEFPMSWTGECLAMDTSNATGQWINIACSTSLPVVCERRRQ